MPTERPLGRHLSDFGKLSFAEAKLLRAAARGERCEIASGRPEAAFDQNIVRADFIRFLALGGDDANQVHENGVWLVGAWIEGVLAIDFCILSGPLRLQRCRLDRLDAHEAQLPRLDLQGTWVKTGINADGIRVAGSILFRRRFAVSGEVRILGGQIGGNLECDGGSFNNKDRVALILDGAKIKGSVFLRGSFNAQGEVRLLGAQIDGSLDCTGGSFNNKGKDALNFGRATVKGSVFLRNKFNAKGAVRLLAAQIGNNLDCSDGSFDNEGKGALSLDGAGIKGAVFLRAGFAARGRVALSGAQIGSLSDRTESWPESGQLLLDGITIGSLLGGAPTSGEARVEWLKRQRPSHLTSDFRPQPWEETIRVLRSMGHEEDAKIVAIAKQDQMRAARKFVGVARDVHWLWGLLAGYGYRPTRLLGVMAGIWLVCAAAFAVGAQHGLFAPSNPIIHTNPALREACAPSGWIECTLPDEYTTFSPLYYSLDVILPVIDLQQEADWAPVVTENAKQKRPGVLLRWLMWFEILAGWLGSLLLIAIFTNLVKKD